MSPALSLEDVACRRGGRLLFAGVSLALGPGDAMVVTGANGCGKSSLLRVIAGLLPTFGGVVAREGSVTLMGEASALDGDRRLEEALLFWARLDDRGDPAKRVAAGLAAMALNTIADVPVRLLSTGQRRRAALTRVVASETDLWLLDEPANGLDVASVGLLEAAIARHRNAGGLVLVATHQAIDLPGAVTLDLATHGVAA